MRDWERHRAAAEERAGRPGHARAGLVAAGAAARFADLDPLVDDATARWAVGNCHLMRNRFTVVDLLDLLGRWTENDHVAVLAAADASLGAAGRSERHDRDLVIGIDSSTTAAKAVVWDARGPRRRRGPGDLRAQLTRSRAGASRTPRTGGPPRAPRSGARRRRRRAAGRRPLDHPPARDLRLRHRGRRTRCARRCCGSTAGPPRRSPSSARSGCTGSPASRRTRRPAWYKLHWLRSHEPETLERADRVVDVQAYLVHRLTGDWRRAGPARTRSACSTCDLRLRRRAARRRRAAPRADAGAARARRGARRDPGRPGRRAGRAGGPARGRGRRRRPVGRAGRRRRRAGLGLRQPGHGAWSPAASARATRPAGVPGPVRRGAAELHLRDPDRRRHLQRQLVRRQVQRGRPAALGLDLSAEQILETAAAQLPPGAERPARRCPTGPAR